MRKIMTKEEWYRKKRRKRMALVYTTVSLFMVILFMLFIIITTLWGEYFGSNNTGKETITEVLQNGAVIQLEYLTPNENSRPQIPLKRIKGVVVHYTANPGTSAINNRNYFEGLSIKKTTFASSHYIIGLEGEIIQCIPLTEEAYASNNRNKDTIAIECCHPDETGAFNNTTYESLVSLTAALCLEFDLKESEIIRHYDVTGKLCPKYYVEHEDEWKIFKKEVIKTVKQMKEAADK